MRYMVQALHSKNQGISRLCLGCSWRPCYILGGGPTYQTWSIPNLTLTEQWDLAYPYLHHRPYTTTPLMRYIVQALVSSIEVHSSACLGSSWRLCRDIWGDPPLSDVLHTSYNTHKAVGSSISIPASSSLDHYTTGMVQAFRSRIQVNS